MRAWGSFSPHLRRLEGPLVLLFFVVVVVAAHPPLWWPGGPPTTLSGDAATSYWQDVAFAVETLRDGELPRWNPFERGGYPFAADPQAAVWSPLSWLVWLLGLVSGSRGPWLQELRQLAAPTLAGAGLYLFLRLRGLSRPAALLGGITVALGAFAQRTITMATFWPWAYLGLCLAAIERARALPGWTATRALAGALILLATAGFPPSIFYALLIAGPYALTRLASAPGPVRRPLLATYAGAGALAGLAALAIVAPLVEQTALSGRAERGLDYVLSNPAHLADLATLVDPAAPGKGLFVGLVALGLALVSLVDLRDRGRRGLVIFWLGIGGLGLGLGLADESPLLRLCATTLPGFGLFRVASRYLILTHTALAVLAAIGADALLRRGRGRLGLGIVVASLIVQVVDLRRIEVRGAYAAEPDLEADADLVRSIGDRRIYNEWGLGPRGGSVYRVRDWRGRSLDPMSFARYLEAEAALARGPGLLRHFAVDRLLTGRRREIPSRPRIPTPSRIRGLEREAREVWRFTDTGPEVFWSAAIDEVDEGAALARMAAIEAGERVVVDRGTIDAATLATIAGGAELPAVEGAVIERRVDRLSMEVDAPAAGVVVSAEVWHPGWEARVDGEAAPVLRVQHLLRGVVVGPGAHRIDFVYAPRSAAWTAPIFFIVIGVLALGGVMPRRSRRTPARG